MIVKTRNPIRTVNVNVKPNASFSYAIGDKIINAVEKRIEKEEGGDDGDVSIKKGEKPDASVDPIGGTTANTNKKTKTGYFSKGRRTERKTERKDEKEKRRAARKAKYGARALSPFNKQGRQFYKDNLPKLRKKADGNFEKTLPDGSKVDVPKEDVILMSDANNKSAPQIPVEKKEVQDGLPIIASNGVATKDVPLEKTEEALNDKGQVQTYKKADVVDADSKDAKKPMSTLVKVGLGVGAAAVLGIIIYLVVRPKK